MYKNYFYIFRCVQELEIILKGYRIVDIYTQEKDKLFFHIPLPEKPDYHLIISTNPHNPFVTIKEDHRKAKKNTINFFTEYSSSVILSVKIAIGDRVIRLEMDTGMITVIFRGGKSNVIFSDSINQDSTFKKISADAKEQLTEEVNNYKYTSSIEEIYSFLADNSDEKMLRKLPSIGKELIKETDFRSGNFRTDLKSVIKEILTSYISVYFNEDLGTPAFHPESFRSIKLPEGSLSFDNYLDAINKYFSLTYSRSNVKDLRKDIDKFIKKELESISNKLNNLKVRVDTGTKEAVYHHYGDLLLANINSIRRGMKGIDLDDYKYGCKLNIVLDEKLSPNQNVDKYYDKSRAEKIEFKRSQELLTTTAKTFDRLIKIREIFERTEEQTELLQIKKELKMTSQQSQKDDTKDKLMFRHFLIENKYHIFVGKDGRNNDLLTTKFAKQNDFWFHARSVSGSHVVLRVENTKEVIPKNILMKTASVAAFYSKAKTSKLVPVTYTLKKYVNKNARHEIGQVTVTKENVLLVKPEIPNDCEAVIE